MESIKRRLRWYKSKFTYNSRLRVNGLDFKVPCIDGVKCHKVDPWMQTLLKHLLTKNCGPLVDVGANLGQTLMALKAISPGHGWIGIEPNPSCVYYLRKLIEANSFHDCAIYPVGIHTSPGFAMLDLYSDQETSSGASLTPGFRQQPVGRSLPVPVFPLDTVIESSSKTPPAVVKIDVEGGELEVIQSMGRCLKQSAPTLIVEVLPVYSPENTQRLDRQTQLMDEMNRNDYEIHRILKDENQQLALLEPVDDFGIHSDLSKCDYLMTPESLSLSSLRLGELVGK